MSLLALVLLQLFFGWPEGSFFLMLVNKLILLILFFFKICFCRFAILSNPTIPIIGEGVEEANDRSFILFFFVGGGY